MGEEGKSVDKSSKPQALEETDTGPRQEDMEARVGQAGLEGCGKFSLSPQPPMREFKAGTATTRKKKATKVLVACTSH